LMESQQADFTYLKHGKYLSQIRGYLNFFDKQQMHVVFFEEMIHESQRDNVLRNIFQFLEVDPCFKVRYEHLNKSGKPKSEFLVRFLRSGHILKQIKHLLPFSLRKKLGKSLHEINISNKEIDVDITQEIVQEMEKYYYESVQELSNLYGRD